MGGIIVRNIVLNIANVNIALRLIYRSDKTRLILVLGAISSFNFGGKTKNAILKCSVSPK